MEKRRKGPEKILEEIIVENFPKMGKEIITQVQETQRVPNRINPIQRSNPGLLHCRWALYPLSHQASPAFDVPKGLNSQIMLYKTHTVSFFFFNLYLAHILKMR